MEINFFKVISLGIKIFRIIPDSFWTIVISIWLVVTSFSICVNRGLLLLISCIFFMILTDYSKQSIFSSSCKTHPFHIDYKVMLMDSASFVFSFIGSAIILFNFWFSRLDVNLLSYCSTWLKRKEKYSKPFSSFPLH